MLEILSQRADVWGEIRLIASARSAGRKLRGARRGGRGRRARRGGASTASTSRCSTCRTRSPREWAPIAAARGAVVVDNSGAFRMDPDVPLVVPEVNAARRARTGRAGIIANPNCTTLSMIVALGALHRRVRAARAGRRLVPGRVRRRAGRHRHAARRSSRRSPATATLGHRARRRPPRGRRRLGPVPGAAGAQRRAVGRLAQGRRLVLARS